MLAIWTLGSEELATEWEEGQGGRLQAQGAAQGRGETGTGRRALLPGPAGPRPWGSPAMSRACWQSGLGHRVLSCADPPPALPGSQLTCPPARGTAAGLGESTSHGEALGSDPA